MDGKNYAVVKGNKATEVESITAVIEGRGNFTGRRSRTWSLKKAELTEALFGGTGDRTRIYDGREQTVQKPILKAGYTGCGEIRVLYAKEAASGKPSEDAPVFSRDWNSGSAVCFIQTSSTFTQVVTLPSSCRAYSSRGRSISMPMTDMPMSERRRIVPYSLWLT